MEVWTQAGVWPASAGSPGWGCMMLKDPKHPMIQGTSLKICPVATVDVFIQHDMIILETNPLCFYYLPLITQIISAVFAIRIVFLVHCSCRMTYNLYGGLNISVALYSRLFFSRAVYKSIVWTTTTFTFMHLADTFIQSDLQYIQVIHFLSVCVFPGNWTHNLCAANAML